jgi:hypothetical protein
MVPGAWPDMVRAPADSDRDRNATNEKAPDMIRGFFV